MMSVGRGHIVVAMGAALALAVGSAALSPATERSERPRLAPRAALVSNGTETVKTELGSYCVERETGGGLTSVCLDTLGPAAAPKPRLEVTPGMTLQLRFRDAPRINDEVRDLSISLLRIRDSESRRVGSEMDAERLPGSKRRWQVVLPSRLRRANALEIFALLEAGDATFTAGLRPTGGPQEPARVCPSHGGIAFDTQRLVGLELAQAQELAAGYGCTVRVVVLDGVPQVITEDFSESRVNVRVDAGRVTAVDGVY
jgi:hypothetical protein